MEHPEDSHSGAPELGAGDAPAKKIDSKETRDSGIWKKGEDSDELISPEEEARLEMKRAETKQAVQDEAAIAQARMEAKMADRGPGSLETSAAMHEAVGASAEALQRKESEAVAKGVEYRSTLLPENAGSFEGEEEIEVTDDMLTEIQTGAHVDAEAAKTRLVAAEARLAELNGAGGVDALEKSLKDKYGYDVTNVVGRSGIMGKMKMGFKSLLSPGFSAMKKTYEMRLTEKNALQEQVAMDKAIVADPEGFAARSKAKASERRMSRPTKGSSGSMGIGRKGPQ